MALSIDEVLSAEFKPQTSTVECPEWDGSVNLVSLEDTRFDTLHVLFLNALRDSDDVAAEEVMMSFVSECWADTEFKRTPLTDEQKEQLRRRFVREPELFRRIFEEALKLHFDVEEAEKN